MKQSISKFIFIAGFLCSLSGLSEASLTDLGNGIIYEDTNDQYWIKDMSLFTDLTYDEQISSIEIFNSAAVGEYHNYTWCMASYEDMVNLWTYDVYALETVFDPTYFFNGEERFSGRYNKLNTTSIPSHYIGSALVKNNNGVPSQTSLMGVYTYDTTSNTYTSAWVVGVPVTNTTTNNNPGQEYAPTTVVIAPPQLSVSTSGLEFSLSWISVPGATGYTLHYAPHPYLGAHTIGQVSMGEDTSFSYQLWNGASYYVTITASDGSSESGYSNVELFTINDKNIGNLDGIVVKDGLIWQQSDDGISRKWNEANSYCDRLTLAGYSDWQLPTINELKGLIYCSNGKEISLNNNSDTCYSIDYGFSFDSPTILPEFDAELDMYWSDTLTGQVVNFENSFTLGLGGSLLRDSWSAYVRCVSHAQ